MAGGGWEGAVLRKDIRESLLAHGMKKMPGNSKHIQDAVYP